MYAQHISERALPTFLLKLYKLQCFLFYYYYYLFVCYLFGVMLQCVFYAANLINIFMLKSVGFTFVFDTLL